MSGDWSSHPNVPLEIRGRAVQPVSLPGENNKNHVSLQECPLTETICLGCIMLAGDTGCPPGSGLVHMKYLAVVTGARCDFIGHVPSLPSWPAQYSDCHLSSSLTLGLCLYSLSLHLRHVCLYWLHNTRVVWFYLPHYCPLMLCKPITYHKARGTCAGGC